MSTSEPKKSKNTDTSEPNKFELTEQESHCVAINQHSNIEHKLSDDDALRLALQVGALVNDKGAITTLTGLGNSEDGALFAMEIAHSLVGHDTEDKVLLIDVNFKKPCLHDHADISQSPGLLDILESKSNIEETMIHSEISGLYILPAGKNHADNSIHILRHNLTTLLTRLKTSFSTIILCTSNILNSVEAELAITLSESVIVVTRSGEASKTELRAISKKVDDLGSQLYGVILAKQQ